jgi:sigma-B regulation protein RsbU (phosphoserine phosphatase)
MAIAIADVVGKGMPAALMMANLHAAVRSRATEATSPKSLCGELNHVMANNVAVGKFITFFYGLIDLDKRRLTYTNAGHNPPILMRANGEVEFLHVGGGVLAVSEDWGYDQEAAELHPNDRILLYTDGATEVWDTDGRELGENGLVDLLLQTRQLSVQDAQEALLRGVAAFANGSFADDVTLVVVDLYLRDDRKH